MKMTKGQVAVGRQFGASPGARERMQEADQEAIWTGACRHCAIPLKGTLKQLREHRCSVEGRDGQQA